MVGEGVIKALSTRRHIKVTVDNIDGRILANQVILFVFFLFCFLVILMLNVRINNYSVIFCDRAVFP